VQHLQLSRTAHVKDGECHISEQVSRGLCPRFVSHPVCLCLPKAPSSSTASPAVHSGTTNIMENEGYHERCIFVPTQNLLEEMYRAKLIPQINEESDSEFDSEDLQEEERMELYTDEVVHWARNNEVLQGKLSARPPKWRVEALLSTGYTLVRDPTASKVSSVVMHPGFYRAGNMAGVRDMDELARIILPPHAATGWRELVAAVKEKRAIKALFRRFVSLIQAPETEVEACLTTLIDVLGNELGVQCCAKGHQTYAVGGLLAQKRFVVHGRTDVTFVDDSGRIVFVTETKTCRSFPTGRAWYHKSRGVQTLGSLFSFSGVRAPVLLVTPQQFKILFLVTEAGKMPQVYTFPPGPEVHLCGSYLAAEGLVDAVCISLLRSAPVVDSDALETTPSARTAPGRLFPTEQTTERQLRHMRRAEETGNGGSSSLTVRRLKLDSGLEGTERCAGDGNVHVGAEDEMGDAGKENWPYNRSRPHEVLQFPWTEVSVFSVDELGLASGEVESESDEF
jgi:hypothetical protein